MKNCSKIELKLKLYVEKEEKKDSANYALNVNKMN